MALSEQAELAVRISLKDNVSPGVSKLQRNLGGLTTSLARTGKGVGQVGLGLAKAGVLIGTAVGSGLVLAAKTAIDFQDAFAGVRKTVDASEPELQKIYTDLRALATRIPVKFTDLAQIAQEAGALGVATGDVVGFTDVVARLAAATVGLTPEAAAEAFGKLGNVLFTQTQKADGLVKEYGQMGSALVALGNAGASSEGDIIAVAERFGAAGRAAGLNAAQVLGFSSAIASLGVEPEAGGSSLSRIFGNITKYLGTGDAKAKAFAATTKLSVGEFKKLYAKDASGAVLLFLKNLSKLDKFQQAAVLKKAGITNIRDISAITRLAQNYPELTRQLDLSSKAYDENTALQDVSARRFDTLKNKAIEFKNIILDAGVTLAERFTPAVGRAIDKLAALIALPETQTALKNLGTDIGAAIDKINWNDVKTGVIEFVGLLKGAASAALTIVQAIDKLPASVKEAGLGFIALNKLSGGLIAQGAGNIVGGLAGAAATGLGSRLPGIGKLFAQPVFVTNWPAGGLGGTGVAGGAAGGGLKNLVGGGIIAAAVVQGVQDAGTLLSGFGAVQDAKTPQDALKALQETAANTLLLPPVVRTIFDAVTTWGQKQVAALTPVTDHATERGIEKPKAVFSDHASERGIEKLKAVFSDHATERGIERLKASQTSHLSAAVAQLRATKAAQIAASDRTTRAVHGIPPPKTNITIPLNVRLAVTANSVTRSINQSSLYTANHLGALNKARNLL